MNAHARLRIAFELSFSCCLAEGWDTLRGAIESVAHAHKMIREPKMLRVWLQKEDGEKCWKAFNDAFIYYKKKNLFPPIARLNDLYDYYSQFSEWGTHTTVAALAHRLSSNDSPDTINFNLRYTGADPQLVATSVFSMLDASMIMENLIFRSFNDRLQIDTELVGMRDQLSNGIKRTAAQVIEHFKIPLPSIRS
jgi:hypothetical protein